MNIPVKAEVHCADGACGRTTRVVINPATNQVTHIVVEVKGPTPEVVVPVERIMESDTEKVMLTTTCAELEAMPQFREVEYLTGEGDLGIYAPGAYVLWPYLTPLAGVVPIEHENVPPGELAVRRGSDVHATDGNVGHVDAFLVNPRDGRISHLIVRGGPLWDKKNVSIPVAQIERIEEDGVYLRIDQETVGALPDIPATPPRV